MNIETGPLTKEHMLYPLEFQQTVGRPDHLHLPRKKCLGGTYFIKITKYASPTHFSFLFFLSTSDIVFIREALKGNTFLRTLQYRYVGVFLTKENGS
jgi:hypothetical protein